MAKMLKNLKMTSVDLVPAGANQHAFVRLFKSKKPDTDTKSEDGIVENIRLGITKALESWFKKSQENTAVPQKQEGDEELDMKFNKSKMTAEDLAMFTELAKKYGETTEPVQDQAADPRQNKDTSETNEFTLLAQGGVGKSTASQQKECTDVVEKLHPEVKKALDEVEQLKKSALAEISELKKTLETEQLKNIASKYEVLGKDPAELCKKLYDIKKAGGTAYDDYVGLLDEQLLLVEKSGLFSEIGSNTSGGKNPVEDIEKAATELMKSDGTLSREQAFVKACEQNPELLAQYEGKYNERRLR